MHAQRPMRTLVLALLLLATTLLPSPAAASDALAVPLPRVGDRIAYHAELRTEGASEPTISVTLVAEWGAPVPFTDAYGRARTAFPLHYDECDGCDAVASWIDIGSRHLVARDEWPVAYGGEARIGVDGVLAYEYERASHGQGRFHRDVFTSFHGLQGLTLQAGDTITRTDGWNAEGAGGGVHTLTAIGWEAHEGALLFRVDHEQEGVPVTRLWYDGVAPFPVHAERIYESSTHRSVSTTRVLWYEPAAEGATLVADGYVAPAPTRVAEDAPRAPFGPDGPAEDGFAFLPLPEAAALARGDLRAAAFFEEEPDAYLVDATFRSPWSIEHASWELTWRSDGRFLEVLVSAPLLPHGTLAARVEEVHDYTSLGRTMPSLDAMVGREFACFAQLARLHEQMTGRAADDASLQTEATMEVTRTGDLRCELETRPREGNGAWTEMTVYGESGGVLREFRGDMLFVEQLNAAGQRVPL